MQKAYAREFPEIYRGIVEDNVDPKGVGRCKVRVPGIHGDSKDITHLLPWAEPIVLSPVSKGRGSINLPDVGDWVWVFFEGARKEYPLYLGGFYSEGDGLDIGENASDSNVTIYTEEGNAITYDRSNKSYTINIGDVTLSMTESDVTISGDTSIEGNLNVNGDLTVTGDLLVDRDAYFSENIRVRDTVYCENLIINGSGSIGGFDVSTDNLNTDDIQEAINLGLLDPGDFSINQLALSQLVEKLANGESVPGVIAADGYCQKFVRTLFEKAGLGSLVPTAGSAISAFNNWGGAKQRAWSENMPYGSTVYWSGGSGGNGHVAVYIGRDASGQMTFMHNTSGKVQISHMKSGSNHIVEGIKSESHQFAGWIPACGSPT